MFYKYKQCINIFYKYKVCRNIFYKQKLYSNTFYKYKLYTIMGTLANVMSDTTKNLLCDKHHNANYVL